MGTGFRRGCSGHNVGRFFAEESTRPRARVEKGAARAGIPRALAIHVLGVAVGLLSCIPRLTVPTDPEPFPDGSLSDAGLFDVGPSDGGPEDGADANDEDSCAPGFTDSNGKAQGGKCVSNTSGTTAACDPGYEDTNGGLDGGTCRLFASSCSESGPGRSDCGDGGESCCTSLAVPGGTFVLREFTNFSDGGTGDASVPATVSAYRLDKYEVTVGRFRKFVDAWVGGWRPSPGAGRHTHLNEGRGLANIAGGHEVGWDPSWAAGLTTNKLSWDDELKCDSAFATWTSSAGSHENRPINCVTWYEAYAFCIWEGGFLPSETEWNYAASGGSQQRSFPWSASATSTVIDSLFASYDCHGDGIPGCSLTDILVVGTKPAGNARWGHADLGGNVLEWNLDWYGFYGVYSSPCSDCVNGSNGVHRVGRGGSFLDVPEQLRASRRDMYSPTDRRAAIGVRCSRTPYD
jgi:formylglycine-generating enzyme required for sulfatase activity